MVKWVQSHILKKSPIALTYSRIVEGVTESKYHASLKNLISSMQFIYYTPVEKNLHYINPRRICVVTDFLSLYHLPNLFPSQTPFHL